MMKKTISLKVNVVLNVIRVGLGTLFPLITFPYVSRVLGPVNLGQVSFAKSVINYFALFAALGIPTYGVLACSKVRDDKENLKRTVCELLYINLFLMIVTYVIFFSILFLVPKFWQLRKLLLINSISIMMTSIGIDWLYSALEDFKYITIRATVFKFVSVVLIFSFVKQSDDYIVYAFILTFSEIGSNILNLIHARQYVKFYPIGELNCKRHIKPIVSLFTASIAATISANTDTVMLGFLKGDYEVGIYNFSVKIKSMLSTIMTAGLAVFIPRFSYYMRSNQITLYRTQIRRIFLLTLTIAFALNAFVVAFCEPIIMILGGSEYADAKIPVIILTSCICVLACTWTLGVAVLQPIGREMQYAKGMLLGCIVNVGLNTILIPIWGVVGSAVATLIGESVIAIAFHLYTKDFLDNILHRIGLFKIFIVSFSVGVFSYSIVEVTKELIQLSDLFQIIIGGIVFLSLFTFLICAVHKEIRTLLQKQLQESLNCLKVKRK